MESTPVNKLKDLIYSFTIEHCMEELALFGTQLGLYGTITSEATIAPQALNMTEEYDLKDLKIISGIGIIAPDLHPGWINLKRGLVPGGFGPIGIYVDIISRSMMGQPPCGEPRRGLKLRMITYHLVPRGTQRPYSTAVDLVAGLGVLQVVSELYVRFVPYLRSQLKTSHHALRWVGRLVESQEGLETKVSLKVDLIGAQESVAWFSQ
ncbi:hypothetical protein M9H77_26720 [Catharanthus roseus]|uniref:Uncharacterized protein n=1 Tax=Catharanthus roseus TaxID=4058 RepID=A0ACC0AAF9_CATRO|nr:hypothetical protein M9H77_26720 [Catharanthus roseus]